MESFGGEQTKTRGTFVGQELSPYLWRLRGELAWQAWSALGCPEC